MNTKKTVKLVREGGYAAEVEVTLLDEGTGWAPYLSVADTRKFDEVRIALRRHDLKAASPQGLRTPPIPNAAA